jgi:hypothetical protein
MATMGRRLRAAKPQVGGGGGGFSPLSIPWVSAYWAEDPSWSNPGDGNAVSSWRDAGTAAADVAQATGSVQPTYRASVAALNSKPAIQFDGADHLDATGISTIAQPFCVVTVLNIATVASNQIFINDQTGTSDNLLGVSTSGPAYSVRSDTVLSAGTATTGGQLLVVKFDGASTTLEKNGSVAGTGNAGTVAHENARYLGGTSLGAAGLSNGHLAFVGFIGRDLTSQERSDLLAWSQSHYGTP